MGGQIRAESNDGAGSKFTFDLVVGRDRGGAIDAPKTAAMPAAPLLPQN